MKMCGMVVGVPAPEVLIKTEVLGDRVTKSVKVATAVKVAIAVTLPELVAKVDLEAACE